VSEIIHVAGPPILVGTVERQRCTWCGALIDERDHARIAVQVDPSASPDVQQEEANRAAALKWRGLVAIDGNVRWAVDEPEDGKVPPTSCMAIPDAVTT
jgi:hypothetical protein